MYETSSCMLLAFNRTSVSITLLSFARWTEVVTLQWIHQQFFFVYVDIFTRMPIYNPSGILGLQIPQSRIPGLKKGIRDCSPYSSCSSISSTCTWNSPIKHPRHSTHLTWTSSSSGHSARTINYFSYFILTTLLATFNPTFVCLQMTGSCIVLLHLKMTPVSCKMIYLLYLNGQKLGRWGLFLRSATYCPSLINVTSLLLFTTLEQTT